MRDLAIKITVEKGRAVQDLKEVDSAVAHIGTTAADVDAKTKSQQEHFQKYFADSNDQVKKSKRGFDDFVKGLGDGGRQMRSVGLSLSAGITAPLAGMATAATMAGLNFEKVMNQITGVVRPTAAELDSIRAKAIDMGAATVFSATDAATAILELGKAGLSTSDSLAAVDKVLQLAAASGLSMGDAAEMSARTLGAFGLKTQDLAHVNDVLAKAVNASTLEITDLQTAFRYVGPLATGVGMSIEQVSAALAIMRDHGIAAETSGRALREGLGRLLNPTKAVKEGLERLGVSVTDSTGKLLPFAEIIQRLEPHAKDTGAILKVFGDAAGPGMAALLSSGSAALVDLTQQLEHSEGSAKAMADAMMTGLPGAFERLKGSVETSLLSISKALEPVLIPMLGLLERLANFITNTVVPAFTALPAPVQDAIIVFGGLAAAIGPILVVAGALASSVAAILPWFAAGTTGATLLAGAFELLTGPIGLVAAAVTGLAAIWATWGDDITSVVNSTFGVIKKWFVDEFGPIVTPVLELLKSVMEMFEAFGKLVFAVHVKVIEYVMEMVKDVTFWIVDKLRPIWEPIGRVISTVATVFHDVMVKAVDYARLLYEGVKKWLVDQFVGIINSVKGKVDAVTGFFKDMYDKVVGHSYVPDMVREIGQWFDQLDGIMVGAASRAVDGVLGTFAKMSGMVLNILGDLGVKVNKGFGEIVGGLFGGGQFATLGATIGSIIPGIGTVIGGAIGGAIDIGKGVYDLFKNDDWLTGGSYTPTPDERRQQEEQYFRMHQPDENGPTATEPTMGGEGLGGGPRYDAPIYAFARGTRGQFVDFGAGTPAILHGRERVVTEAEGRREQASPRPDRPLVIQLIQNGRMAAEVFLDNLNADEGGMRRAIRRVATSRA